MTDPPKIQYLNTDLDLVAAFDLTGLTAALELLGVFPLHVTEGEDGFWSSYLETEKHDHTEPDANIREMLTAIESLPPEAMEAWNACTTREFNVGYDCGDEPWAFNQGLSNDTLRRMAQCGATFRVTIYPYREEGSSKGMTNS
jgi:hypothetical protein